MTPSFINPVPQSPMTDHPIRPAFWNVPLWGEIGVYVLGFTAVALLIAGILRNRRLWLRGAEDPHPVKDRRARLFSVIADVFTQKKIRETSAGRLHAVLAWGFFLLFCGTALATLDWDVGHYAFDAQFLQGGFYLAYKFVLDCAGIAVLIVLALGAARRWSKESGLPGDARFVCAYLSLAFIVLTGFLVEGIRLAATLPAWSVYSPIGHLVAKMLLACGLSEAELRLLHTWIWTIHGISSLAFIAAVPLTYYAHVYRTPAGLFTREEKPAGLLRKIDDIEEQETFGVSNFSQFTTRERTAFDACTECGRCTAACPAVRAGTPLDPRALIVSLRDRMHMEEKTEEAAALPSLEETVSRDALWSCTTCGACSRACPAGISLPEIIVNMRRHLALEAGDFPEGVANALENTASVGNPWGLDPYERLDWAKDLDVPVAESGVHYDVLYWVGCAASYDRRARKIARSMVRILKATGVNFAVMAEERCHGEFARRLGEEYLYQTAAQENIGNFAQYDFDRILTACPHCFNTLKNEYPSFEDFRWPVVSHAVFIDELMKAGSLPYVKSEGLSAVYHDPCYLARINGIVAEPRSVLNSVCTVLKSPAESGERTLCCGAGGGQMWIDRHGSNSVNVIRLKDLRASGADTIAVSCPHCLTMLESARAVTRDAESVSISDIAELVAAALPEEGASK